MKDERQLRRTGSVVGVLKAVNLAGRKRAEDCLHWGCPSYAGGFVEEKHAFFLRDNRRPDRLTLEGRMDTYHRERKVKKI